MNGGELLSVDAALGRLLADAGPLDRENVPIGEAGERVLAEPLAALRSTAFGLRGLLKTWRAARTWRGMAPIEPS